MRKSLTGTAIIALITITAISCRNSKLMTTAKENARQFGLARCECDKLQKKDPPGDMTLCFDQMQQARRYLTFNFEMGKFSESEKAEVMAFGDQVYNTCMAESKAR